MGALRNKSRGDSVKALPRDPGVVDDLPEVVRQVAMLRGLGYSYREIAEPLHLSPQAASVMLARHRRSLKSLRGVMELCALSPRAVNVLGRHGIRTREQARQANVLERLAGERNCGLKTVDEIARWMKGDPDGLSGSKSKDAASSEPAARPTNRDAQDPK